MINRTKRPLLIALAVLTLVSAFPLKLAAEPPKLRLPDTAKPLSYAVDLTIFPEKETFDGSIEIDLSIKEAASVLWLNAKKLTIAEAALVSEAGTKVTAKVQLEGDEFVSLTFDQPVGPGKGKLKIRYQGVVERKSTDGLFAQLDGSDWYAFSQFEATYARRAFPCFDEPSYKTPWRLTLHIPKNLVAVSNTPIASETIGADGLKTVVFAQTKPLPTYLVALGVGPFEFVDAGKAGKKGTPIRMVVPKGHASEAKYAAETTPKILTLLEDYFGTAYPYEKLDNLAIPQTVAFGAMENAGLITYSQNLMLARPEDVSIGFMRGYASVCAHETAHQWFGDLVTMAWWNDVWLNEGFATWMANKIVDRWKPEWDARVSRVTSRNGAMGNDTLVTARKIRQPIEKKGDIENAFDGITYTKGAAVLSMFETYMSEAKFQKGVQRYIAQHAFGTATTDEFLAALATEGGAEIPTAFSTFLDQAGTPLVTVALEGGASGTAQLALSQKRFLPVGSKGSANQTWQIPLCVRWAAAGKPGRACTLMTSATATLPIPVPAASLDFVLANEGLSGYYRTEYEGDLLERLLKDGAKPLTLPEKVGVFGDVNAIVQAGGLPMGDALSLVPRFAGDPNRHVVASMAGVAGRIRENLVPDELRPNYTRFIQKMFGERARALGFAPKPGEDEDTKLLRGSIIDLVAREGEDATLRAEARQLVLKWLDDRKAVDPNSVNSILPAAVQNGDKDLWERFYAEAKKSKNRRDTDRLLGSLGLFENPEIEKRALALVLGDDFDARQSVSILWVGLGNRVNRPLVWTFLTTNFDKLMEKLPEEYGSFIPMAGSPFCSEEKRTEVESFFKDRVAKYPGAPRNLAQTLESISLCTAFRTAQLPSVASFLKSY